MVINTKKAFSLAEVIMSMMILTLVSLATIPILSKQAPQIASSGIRGQYGCWVEGGSLVEQYFDERTPRTKEPQPVSTCTLKLDQRPNRYYILASGAGGSDTHGQTVTAYADAIDNELKIEIGRSAGQDTIIYDEDRDNPIILAQGGVTSTNNGLIAENIRFCRLISANCSSTSTIPKSCEVTTKIEVDESTGTTTQIDQIRINGCEQEDEFGNYLDTNLINLSDLTLSSAPSSVSASPSNIRYTYGGFSMAFDLLDSSFVNTDLMYETADESKMSKILKEMTPRRRTTLTKRFTGDDATPPTLSPGMPNNPGAVIILW